MKTKLKCWEKTTRIIEPRIEITKVKNKYEVYREPQGDISKFSKKDLLEIGIKEKDIKSLKGTTYFVRRKC